MGHLLVLGPILAARHGGFLLPGVVGAWVTALLAAMAGLAAPGAAQAVARLVEETAEAAKSE